MKKFIAIILSIMLVLAVTLQAAAVSTVAVKGIKLDSSSVTLKIGQTSDLKVTFTPENTTQKILSYVTSNKNVVTVNAKGQITAVHSGNATITVFTSNKNVFAKCKISVPVPQKVKLTYSYWGAADEQKVVDETLNKFNISHENISVKGMVIPWENYNTKLNTMATAGELPDMGAQQESNVIRWAAEGMLADTSSMFKEGEAKPLDALAYKYKGKIVAWASANEVLLLYYNKDMFDKAKVAYPPSSADKAWTWDQFVATAKKLTFDKNGKSPDQSGFDAQNIKQYGALVENLPWQLETWAVSNGGGYYSKDGSKVIINDPASIEGIQKVADLYLKEHVAPLSTGASDDSIQRSIISRTCAMGTGGQWNIGTCLGSAKAEGLNYGVAVLPYMKKKTTLCTASMTAIFSQTKHLEECFEYIKWNNLEENNWAMIKSGILMPRLEKWYTDEKLTHKWVNNPNFPPYDMYKSAVVDYSRNMSITQPAAWFYVDNTTDFNNLVNSILGNVWTGKTTAEKAITSNYDALVAAFEGKSK